MENKIEFIRHESEIAEDKGNYEFELEVPAEVVEKMLNQDKPLGYLAGNIMGFGDNLARQYEYNRFKEAGIPGKVYSPVMNKSINDKTSVTEEENNKLAEKITDADIERLWNSNYVVICPEQNAIGTMCELGCLYGWHYMSEQLITLITKFSEEIAAATDDDEKRIELYRTMVVTLLSKIISINQKSVYAHYSDIRTNHLNEKDWRRSFSINQLLYGMILACTSDHTLHNSFDEIIPILQDKYGVKHDAED